jgi:hypothetical protein
MPFLHNARLHPAPYLLPETFVIDREVLSPVIKLKVSLTPNGRAPTHTASLLEDVHVKASLGQGARCCQTADSGSDDTNGVLGSSSRLWRTHGRCTQVRTFGHAAGFKAT